MELDSDDETVQTENEEIINDNNDINNEPSQNQLTQIIADMISSNKYSEDEINDVICGKKIPPEIIGKLQVNIKKQNIDTVGVEINDPIIKSMTRDDKLSIKQCSMCARCFNKDMITCNDEICWHCYFWMNYDIDKRPICDGPEGMTIVQYILKCHEEHDTNNCPKFSAYNNCFLCDYKLDHPILCVQNEELLKSQSSEPEKVNTNELSTPRIEEFKKITISI